MAARRTAKTRRAATYKGRAVDLARGFRLVPLRHPTDDERVDDCLLELAWDGHHVLATRVANDVHIASADFQRWHERFAPLALALRKLQADDLVVEGFLCALDESGRPSFDRLRAHVAGEEQRVALVMWDLQWLDGEDLRGLPLAKRRARLTQLMDGAPSTLVRSDPLEGDLNAVRAAVGRMGLRGVVARSLSGHSSGLPAWSADAEPLELDRPLSPPPKVTNPDKVLFPRDGLTKTDIADYYRAISDVFLCHVRDRPVVGQRWPDGIDEFTWYQHRVPPRAPDYLPATWVEGNRRIVLRNQDALLWLVNQAALTFHGWTSRIDALDKPDWAIFDLDPGVDTKWETTVNVALALRRALELLELPSVVKTSGQSGLHVLVPIARGPRPEVVHAFAFSVSNTIAHLMPNEVSLSPIPDKRGGRLYLDHLQSFVGKALVLPYSLRAVDGAPISTPLQWQEVTPALQPRTLGRADVLRRLDKYGDLAEPLLTGGVDLTPALKRLGIA